MSALNSILLVEDNPGDARLLREMFKEHATQSSELTLATCMSEAEKHLSEHSVDLILLDLGLPDAQGLEAIRRARAVAPHTPLVVLTGSDDETLAARALQEGTQDYLIKGEIEARGLMRALRYAIERKRLERLKDEFISTVSHELRTPLTCISASLGLLVGHAAGTLPDPASRLLAIASTNCKRLVRLVNDILDMERMESGQVRFDSQRIEIRPLVEQAIEVSRGLAESHGLRFRLESGVAVGDVRADSDRLMQVLTNLLSNAIKFSPHGDEVVVALEQQDDCVRITVRDHGPGISVDFKPHVFERFAQADATDSRQKGGTGLGLSIVKQIVDRLGGEVGFADAPEGGTIFHVALPNWDRAPIALRERPRPREFAKDSARAANRRPRILHVDDDNLVALALGEIADVISVHSVAAARLALEANDFDLAVLDIARATSLPLDPLPDLRAIEGNAVPVVVFSARATNRPQVDQAHGSPAKSPALIESLVATVTERLASRPHTHPDRAHER